MMADWVDVKPLEEFEDGQHQMVDVDDVEIAVFKIKDQLYAIEDVCTHDGGELACGKLEGETIECPRHSAKFCLKTGAVLSPPAYEPIAVFPVRVEQGMVQVKDDRWD